MPKPTTAARLVARAFTTAERIDETGEPVVVVRSDDPLAEQVRDAVRDTHLGALPCDYLFRWCGEAADIIADAVDDECDSERALDEWIGDWPTYYADGRRWAAQMGSFDRWHAQATDDGFVEASGDLDRTIAAVAFAARNECKVCILGLVERVAEDMAAEDEARAEDDREAVEREDDRARQAGDE